MAIKFIKKAAVSTTRSTTVTVRLDPRTRYLAEVAARRQRRSLSSFIEWAIHEALGRVTLDPGESGNSSSAKTVESAGRDLWHIHEADRLAILAIGYPELLNHEEETLWNLIKENGYLWHGRAISRGSQRFEWDVEMKSLKLSELRDLFSLFKKAAKRQVDQALLPALDPTSGTWTAKDPAAAMTGETTTKEGGAQ